jgi:hypothetical protein
MMLWGARRIPDGSAGSANESYSIGESIAEFTLFGGVPCEVVNDFREEKDHQRVPSA